MTHELDEREPGAPCACVSFYLVFGYCTLDLERILDHPDPGLRVPLPGCRRTIVYDGACARVCALCLPHMRHAHASPHSDFGHAQKLEPQAQLRRQ